MGLENIKKEWEIPKAKVIYDGGLSSVEHAFPRHMRIYRQNGDYTAQYFFSSSAGWQISVDLERVSVSDLIRYILEGRRVAREIMQKKNKD